MTDIVERLRTDVLWHQRRGNGTIAADCQEAADEIERLRAAAAPPVAPGYSMMPSAYYEGSFGQRLADAQRVAASAIKCGACVGTGEDFNEGDPCHVCGGSGKVPAPQPA